MNDGRSGVGYRMAMLVVTVVGVLGTWVLVPEARRWLGLGLSPTPVPLARASPASAASSQELCPIAISQSEVEAWRLGEADVPTVQVYIDVFNSKRPGDKGDFDTGHRIPPGVLVATNFDERDATKWSEFPVVAIVHSGSWGLFQTTAQYVAPNAGACLSIVP